MSRVIGRRLGSFHASRIGRAVHEVVRRASSRLSRVDRMYQKAQKGSVWKPYHPDTVLKRRNLLTWSQDFGNAAWTKAAATITSAAAIAPDGTYTAAKLAEDGTTAEHRVYSNAMVKGPRAMTWTLFAKAAERSWVSLRSDAGAMVANFNLSTGAVGTTKDVTASIVPVGNGWYRCHMSSTKSNVDERCTINIGDADTGVDGGYSYIGTSGSGILIWGAQLEKATAATAYQRVTDWNTEFLYGGQEYARYNLSERTEEFSHGYWSKQTGVTVTDGTVVGPSGRMTGATLSWAAAAVKTGLFNASIGTTAGVVYKRAIYVRADSAGGTVQLADPRQTNGVTTLTLSTEWQLLALTESNTINDSGLWIRKTASSPDTVYIAEPDFRLSSDADAVPAYQRVTDGTSDDFSTWPTYQRRNLLDQTDDITGSSWTLSSGATRLSNVATAPDGTLTADSVAGNGTSNYNGVRQDKSGQTAGAANAVSVYLKAGTENHAIVLIDNGNGGAWIDLTTGATQLSGVTAKAEAVGNGWWRFSVYKSAYATTNVTLWVAPTSALGTATSSGSVYVWGAQVEKGSVASTYQPVGTTTDQFIPRRNPKVRAFQDSTGQTPVTKMEDPNGLVLDSKPVVDYRPEQVTNGGFDSSADWTLGGNLSAISGGTLRLGDSGVSPGTATQEGGVFTIGKRYTVEFDVISRTSGSVRVYFGAGASAATAGTSALGRFRTTALMTASETQFTLQTQENPADIIVDNISVREYAAGDELVLSPGFDSTDGFTLGAGWAISGGKATRTTAGSYSELTVACAGAAVIGKLYRMTVKVDAHSGAALTLIAGGASKAFTNTETVGRTITATLRATTTGGFFVQATDANTACTLDSITLTEVPATEECVLNGTFDNGTTGWTSSLTGSVSAVDGALRVTADAASASGGLQDLSLVIGRAYEVVGRVRSVAGQPCRLAIVNNALSAILASASDTTSASWVEQRFIFTATETNSRAYLRVGTAGAQGDFDNISIREIPGNAIVQATTTARPKLDARVNLLVKTSEFDDAAWAKSGATVTANATTDPLGGSTADKLVESATTAGHLAAWGSITYAASQYVASVYAKAGERSWVILEGRTGHYAYFDLSGTGAVGTQTGCVGSIKAEANGWFQCKVAFTPAAGAEMGRVYVSTGNGVASYAGDGTSGIYIWGADLRLASDAPASNLLQKPSEFDNAVWVATGSNVSIDAATAPDGTLTADRIIEDGAISEHRRNQTVTNPAGTYTHRVRAKYEDGGREWVCIGIGQNTGGSGTGGSRMFFNVRTGVKGSSFPYGVGTSLVDSSIKAIGSGWYELSVTATKDGTNALALVYVANTDGTLAYDGDGVSGVLFWKSELLETSRIPCTLPAYQRVTSATDYDSTGFPVFWTLDGSDDSMKAGAATAINGESNITLFAGLCPTGTSAQATSFMRWQDGAGYVVFPWWNGGSSSLFINSSDGGTTGGIASGVELNQPGVFTAQIKRNTTGGRKVRKNGALHSSANAADSVFGVGAEPLSFGVYGTEYFKGRAYFLGYVIDAPEDVDLKTVEDEINTLMGEVYA